MGTLLIRQYQETRSKYLKLSGRLQKSYDNGQFYRLPGRKQNWLVNRVRKLWEKLKMLEKKLKLAIAAGTITLLLTFSDVSLAQPNFVLAPDKNPFPPPLVYGMSPIIYDVDSDGDLDILTTHGDAYIIWFKNVGTPSLPDFIKVPDDENPFVFPDSLDIETWNIDALADIDGDGDVDVFTDDNIFFENTGTAENPVFEPAESFIGYMYDYNLVDIDGDGDLDMVDVDETSYYEPISMRWISTARIRVIKNIGSPQSPLMDNENPVYYQVVNNPEDVDYFNQTSSMDFGNDGDIDFLVETRYYSEINDDYTQYDIIENTGTPQNPQFAFLNDEDNPFKGLFTDWEEVYPADLDNDGDIDALWNENYVGLTFYRNTGDTLVKDETLEDFQGILLTYSYMTPAFLDFDGDGDLDMYTFPYEDDMVGVYYENTGNDKSPEFTQADDYFQFIQTGGTYYFFPIFVDIDNDGDLDCFTWGYEEYAGMKLDFYKNAGTQQSPNYQLDELNNPVPYLEDMQTLPSFADFDGDGDKDMILVIDDDNEDSYYDYHSLIRYYKNTGDLGNPTFVMLTGEENPFNGADTVYEVYASPLVIADLDMDGDFDVFYSDYYGNTYFLENTGTLVNPVFTANEANNPLKDINIGYYGGFSLVDLDGDGDKDLFCTSLYNTIVHYYVNTDPRTSPSGRQQIIHQEGFLKVFPNPASEYCILNIDAPWTGMCEVKIIDINGHLLKSESFKKVNGHLEYQMDISTLVPGIYLIDVTQDSRRNTTRLIIE